MAQRKKTGLRPWHGVVGAVIVLFILFANLVGKNGLPRFLQQPADQINSATGGLLYQVDSKPTLKGLSVHFIDVGQGDSAFIWCGGEAMMIDGGPNASDGKAEQYVAAYGIKTLKYMVPTHPDEDHVGGLVDVVQKLTVQNAIMTDATANTHTFENLLTSIKNRHVHVLRAKVGDRYTLGGATFTIKGPVKEYGDTNDMSIVLKLQYQNRSFLFTGDAPTTSEADMLATGEDLSADVLKVGHHGSKTATSPAFLKAVSPRYGIISVGADNKYGLPNQPVLNRLQAAGVQLLRTDKLGTIVVQTDGNNLTVKTEKTA